MTESDLSPITERLEQLSQELRRQGRAAVAAQAAAESCLSGVEQLGSQLAAIDSEPSDVRIEDPDSTLRALFPLFDALLRVAKESARLEPERPKIWPLSIVGSDRNAERLQSLRHGVRLLEGVFRQAVDHLELVVDQRVGIALDPDVHRVVVAREATAAHPPNTVVEVQRCGYIRDGKVLREADVVATRSPKL